MYALYSRDMGNFQLNGGEVALYWITARSLDMTVPGGVTLKGYVAWPDESDEELPWAEFFRDTLHQSWRDALHVFAGALGLAYNKKLEDEAGESATFEALDYLQPFTTESETHGRKTLFVHSFRESEAAQAAFDAGLRTVKWGEHWMWPALGKIQEKSLASA